MQIEIVPQHVPGVYQFRYQFDHPRPLASARLSREDDLMYMVRNEAEVALGRSAEFEAIVDELSIIHVQNAGFVGATLLQAYANPGRYTLLSRWTDREASASSIRREAFTAFAEKLRNSGLLRPTRLTESYESVFEVDQPNASATSSTAERWVELTLVGAVAAPAVEAHLRETAEVGLEHAPGVVSVRLRRSMGDDTKYLLLIITSDRAAARAWPLVPRIRERIEDSSIRQYLVGAPTAEIHHVVKRFAGPALSAPQSAAVAAANSALR
jgi:quinol monooxygenase YgiN